MFCTFGTPGFLHPLIALATELRRRGHDVAFATGLDAVAALRGVGLERIPRGARDGDSFRIRSWYFPLLAAIDLKHVEHAVRAFAPDVLVSHVLCQSALLARERLGIPVAVMGLLPYLWPSAVPGPDDEAEARRRWRLDDGIRILNQARAAFGMEACVANPADHPLLGDLFLLRSALLLEPRLAALPEQVHAVGGWAWDPPAGAAAPDPELDALLAGEGPLVYVQHGRTFSGPPFWPAVVRGLGDAPFRVAASLGRMDGDTGDVPPNFVVRPHLSEERVMAQANVAVSGGNTSVVLGALRHGLPGVVIPIGGETPDNAEWLAGAGCALPLLCQGLTGHAVRDAVERALDDAQMRAASGRAGAALKQAGGVPRAAELVEAMARVGGRVRRAA